MKIIREVERVEYRKFGSTVALRLEKGEEIMASLTELCRREDIRLGHLAGLGAVDEVEAGLYSVAQRRYHKNRWSGEREIVSLAGNITRKEGEVYLHLHIAVSGQDGAVVGGHLTTARVSATAELFITVLEGEVGRRPDPETGLNLLEFADM